MQAIIEASYDGIVITDNEGIVLRVNKAHERLTGIMTDYMIGKSILDLFKEKLYNDPIVDLIKKRKKPVTFMQNTVLQNCLIITGSPVFDSMGRIYRIVINFRDVTELNGLKHELELTKNLTERYSSELEDLRRQHVPDVDMVFESPQMKKTVDLAYRMSKVDSTILLLGESGVGKDVIANLIHKNSNRNLGSFIRVNCGAIPENLIESEFFGYESGAFTGANKKGKVGLFELAHNGAIFLDEVGELPLGMQTKLLSVIQEKEVVRIGGSNPRKINLRILAATNRDLSDMVKQGTFRNDLYYRLNVIPIYIPPLRERKEDIIPLVYLFKNKLCEEYGVFKNFSAQVMKIFTRYNWPGNVRQLKNIIERLIVTSTQKTIELNDLPAELFDKKNDEPGIVYINGIIPLKEANLQLEEYLLKQAMAVGGSTHQAAKLLGVSQPTIVRKLARLRQNGDTEINM